MSEEQLECWDEPKIHVPLGSCRYIEDIDEEWPGDIRIQQ